MIIKIPMQSYMLVALSIELLNFKKNNVISRCRFAKYLKYKIVYIKFIKNLHSLKATKF
jgi:hypothetical protein